MGKVKADKDGKQPHQDPDFGIDGVEAHLKLLKAETDAIFNAPPPKKEEPKKEEKSADKKMETDGEKKDEAKPEEAPAENGEKKEEAPAD